MNFDKFYLFESELKRGGLILTSEPLLNDPFSVLSGRTKSPAPLNFVHHMGDKVYDVIDTSYAVLYLISERFVQTLNGAGFRGWDTFSVDAYGKGGSPLVGYRGPVVTGTCGPIDKTRCRRESRPPPVPHGNPYEVCVGLYFDPESWDGTDFVLPSGTGHIIVTEKVKTVLDPSALSNIQFNPLSGVEP